MLALVIRLGQRITASAHLLHEPIGPYHQQQPGDDHSDQGPVNEGKGGVGHEGGGIEGYLDRKTPILLHTCRVGGGVSKISLVQSYSYVA